MNPHPDNGAPDPSQPRAPDPPPASSAPPPSSNFAGHNRSPGDNPFGSAEPPAQAPSTSPERRSHSKIGRLPKATRDKLNNMIRDGIPYADIPAKLGDDAKDITARNLSGWQSSPHYQRWLLEQEWFENLRADQESAFDLLNEFDSSKFNEAALQLAVTRVFLALRHIDSGDLNQKLGGNARTFAALVHSLARACRETTNIERYRETCANAVAAQLKQLNLDRELSDNEYQLLVNKMDQVFKVRRHPNPAPANAPPSNGSP